ncbi:MAG: NADPH-dependent FMN reductase [Janthinobacterium lividum]
MTEPSKESLSGAPAGDAARMTIAVLLGSVRRDRQGIKAARFVIDALTQRGHEAVLVDPLELQLPLLDRMYKEHAPGTAPDNLEQLATLYRRADGFLIVSGEYNNGIPPALKNLLDHFLEEYFWRPSGIVCYSAGQFGGVRAAMQLRMTLAEVGMPSIPSLMPIPRIGQALSDVGDPAEDRLNTSLTRFLDEFFWYAQALQRQRASGTPY